MIEGYLNAGTSVIVTNSSVGTTINSNISKSGGGNASLTIKDIGNIKIATNITISSSSNALDLIHWADSDNSQGGTVDDFMYINAGVTISTNGGKIIMAGGPDNGSNGGTSGDGIPDGFAWNGSNSITYGANDVGGLTLGQRGGTGTVVTLLSNGGDMILRGATSNNNSYPGITSQSNLKIVSGTGKITMYGKSSSDHGVELTYGTAPSIAISSASTSSPALDLKGTTTASGYAGFWLSNNANGSILFESTAASGGGMTIEGVSSNSSGLWFGVSNTNIITQLLSQSGTITLKGDGGSNASLYLYGDLYIGNRKDATAIQGVTPSVTASTANILIQADDQYTFGNTAGKNVNINSTGSLTMEAYTAAFSGTLSWTGNVVFGNNFSSIVLGESAENYTITLNTSLTSAGNITAYASDFNLANGIGLTSTGAGNININARGSFATVGTTRRSLVSANGNINVYADSDASGNGQLDIDYLTFNAGTGTTTLRTETMAWTTAASTDKPYFNGTGAVVIEPADAGFQDVSTSWFYFDQDANGIGGLTIGKSGNTGIINHETTALTVAGPVSFHGSTITVSAALTCTAANAAVLVKASGSVTISAGITTNAGAINIWADSDSNGSGGILVNNNTTLDSRTSADRLATTHTTDGGAITLAGGADDGGTASGISSLISGLVAGDGIPDGYAVNSGSLAAQTGIVLGTSTAAAGQNANVSLYSGGGHIRLFGKVTNNTSSPANGPTGIQAFHGHTLNAGTNGDIIFIGNADLTSGSNAIGMDWLPGEVMHIPPMVPCARRMETYGSSDEQPVVLQATSL